MTVSGMRHMNGRYLRDKLKVSLRVTACGREVIMPILGLVWQESMRAVAAMSKKTTVKSDFTRFLFHSKKENHQLLDIICISISRITIMSF